MIGRIIGTLAEKSPPQILVDVGGVGYEIDVPMSTFYNLPGIGERVTLLTHFVRNTLPDCVQRIKGKSASWWCLREVKQHSNSILLAFSAALFCRDTSGSNTSEFWGHPMMCARVLSGVC